MKYFFLISIALLFVLQITSCGFDCDGDFIEEARNFDKDTALMYVWLYDNSPYNKRYKYFAEDGEYRYGDSLSDLKPKTHLVWYSKNNIIYYRGGGETICTVSESLLCKYKIKNDTLFAYFTNGGEFLESPEIYIKVSKHP